MSEGVSIDHLSLISVTRKVDQRSNYFLHILCIKALVLLISVVNVLVNTLTAS